MAANSETLRPTPVVRIKQIALPTEHGGWGLLLEPLVAALAVAFSTGGLSIALMFIGGFLMRQPLKIYVLDRRGMRNDARAAAAMRYLLIYGCLLATGMIGTALTSSPFSLLPLIAVIPLAAVQIYYDIFRRSRNLVPELAGAIAISSSAAAIALAGGQSPIHALGLWVVFIARLIPSIIYVRERLVLEKGKQYSRVATNVTHIIALIAVLLLAFSGVVSVLTVPVMLFMLYRAVEGLSSRRTKLKAMQIGVREVIYGVVLVLAVVTGQLLGI